jgi:ABC-type maltose transport system permease subunit
MEKTHVEFKSLEELRQRAATEGVTLNLREFYSVFYDYRTTWFDFAALAILLLIPLMGFLFLARWVWRFRQLNASPEAPG